MSRKISENDKIRVLALNRIGFTSGKIKELIKDISCTSISRIFVANGIHATELKRSGNRLFMDYEEIEIIRNYKNQPESLLKLAKKYNCGITAIKNTLKKYGLRPGLKNVTNLKENEINEILSKQIMGIKQKQIAKEHNISQTRVSKIIRENNSLEININHPNWKGGRSKQLNGYVLIRISPSHRFYSTMARTNGYCLEHRLIYAEYLGRPLEKYEEVHHKNGLKDDNIISNLELRNHKHGKGIITKCNCCGSHNISSKPIEN